MSYIFINTCCWAIICLYNEFYLNQYYDDLNITNFCYIFLSIYIYMSFLSKYLKYKTKYNLLKNQNGGDMYIMIQTNEKSRNITIFVQTMIESKYIVITEDIYKKLLDAISYNITVDNNNTITNMWKQIDKKIKTPKDVSPHLIIKFTKEEYNLIRNYIEK